MRLRFTTSVAVTILCSAMAGCVGPVGGPQAMTGSGHASYRPSVDASPASHDASRTTEHPQSASPKGNETAAGSDHYRYPMAASGQPRENQTASTQTTPPLAETSGDATTSARAQGQPGVQPASVRAQSPPSSGVQSTVYQTSAEAGPLANSPHVAPTQFTTSLPPAPSAAGSGVGSLPPPPDVLVAQANDQPGNMLGVPSRLTDVIVNVQETQTGRLMIGAGINSDAGVTGQIVVDEKNFDWRRFPRSFDDVINGTAWRGAGQGFRVEALPGRVVQRYMVQFTEPYLFDTRVSFNVSGYLFDRRYFDWDEQRLGGRFGLGYRLTPDLSVNATMRGEEVKITNIRAPGDAPQLDAVAGNNELYSGRVALIHDTRDIPFAPTQGHYLEFAYEQVFGTFDYSRGSIDAPSLLPHYRAP